MKCSSCGKYVDNAAVRSGKRTACPRCGNQLDQPRSPASKAAGILRVHRVLLVVGIILLTTGIVLTIKLDPSGQQVASALIGFAIIAAVGDFFVWRAYKKEAAKEEGGAT